MKYKNDDSNSIKYFDFLDAILSDCNIQLSDFEDTIRVYLICVESLTQLVTICPAIYIKPYIPKITPTLVDLIYFCYMSKYYYYCIE